MVPANQNPLTQVRNMTEITLQRPLRTAGSAAVHERETFAVVDSTHRRHEVQHVMEDQGF